MYGKILSFFTTKSVISRKDIPLSAEVDYVLRLYGGCYRQKYISYFLMYGWYPEGSL